VNDKCAWVDSRFGSSGSGAWFVPLAWLVTLFQLYSISGALSQDGLWVIDMFLFIFIGSLLIGGLQFILIAFKTAQKITLHDEGVCEINFFYWGKMSFNKSQVLYVEIIKLKFYKSLMTPLNRTLDNYKVTLKNGSCFYISGRTVNVNQLSKNFGPIKNRSGS